MLIYRVGWPLWKLAYRMGIKLAYRYEILYDVDCKRYIGISPDIKGLIAECDTVDEVKDVMESDAPLLVSYQVYGSDKVKNTHSNLLVPYWQFAKGLVHG